jgi:uncharacterized protein (TIGR03083 family)
VTRGIDGVAGRCQTVGMDVPARLAMIESEAAALVAAARADLDAPCPSCPEWSAADLLAHVGSVHRRFADRVAAGSVARPPRVEPPAREALVEWVEGGAARLCAVLEAADDAAEIWTWAGAQPVSWVVRRMANETAVHRWDAERITGPPDPPGAEVAEDIADEFLTVYLPTFDPFHGPPARLCLAAGDTGRLWVVDVGETPPALGSADDERECEATLRGDAADIALALWGRVEPSVLEVDGDAELAAEWWTWLAGVRR